MSATRNLAALRGTKDACREILSNSQDSVGYLGCSRQLLFSGLGHAQALALVGATSEFRVIGQEYPRTAAVSAIAC